MKIHETRAQHQLLLPQAALYLLTGGFGLIVVSMVLGWVPLSLWWTRVVGTASMVLGIVICIPTIIREARLNQKI